MEVEFFGVRGSTPATGAAFARFGGHTSCVTARLADGTRLVFDAGTGLRPLGHRLVGERRDIEIHLLLTHLHWDHIIGLPFFAPLYSPTTKLHLYPLSTPEQDAFRKAPVILSPPHHPVSYEQLPATLLNPDVGWDFEIGSARVQRIPLNHPGGAQGFRVDDADGASLVYLTDNELVPDWQSQERFQRIEAACRGAQLLIHDSQYVPSDMPLKRGWGHSVVDDVLELAHRAEVRTLVPFHHDPPRSDVELEALEERCRYWAQQRTPDLEVVFAREGTQRRL